LFNPYPASYSIWSSCNSVDGLHVGINKTSVSIFSGGEANILSKVHVWLTASL
jgi:hypothetical protein